MPEIETQRLLFRTFTPDDLHDLAAIRTDPDVMKYTLGRPESITEVQATLNKYLAHWGQHGFGRWALIERQSTKLIGWCGLSYLEETGGVEIELGYGLAKCHSGKGLASEEASVTMKYGFEELGLARIVAVAWPDNIPSIRVLEKLGMQYEKTVQFAVEWVYYAIAREEYQGKRLV